MQKCLTVKYLVNHQFVIMILSYYQNDILAIFVVKVLDRSNVYKSSCYRLDAHSNSSKTSVEMVKRALTGDGSNLMAEHTYTLWDTV